MLNFHIITLFPETLEAYLNASILGRAQKDKKIKISYYNPRDFVTPTKVQIKNDKPYLRIDDKPYGGGPGMVMQAEPVLKAVAKIKTKILRQSSGQVKNQRSKVFIFSPAGKLFDNVIADKLSKDKKTSHIILICGRYEGLDARVKKILKAQELSVGPYVLTGGEVPAMIVIDAITRRLPGVLGKDESIEERRISSSEVYTRPEVLIFGGKKYRVPKVLLSGHHAEIDKWRTRKKA